MAKRENFKVQTHREIRTKVVGVTQPGRQDLIKKRVKAGMRLLLVAEPDNPVDPLAIAVYIPAGTLKGSAQIGYLMVSELVDELVRRGADRGEVNAFVADVLASVTEAMAGE